MDEPEEEETEQKEQLAREASWMNEAGPSTHSCLLRSPFLSLSLSLSLANAEKLSSKEEEEDEEGGLVCFESPRELLLFVLFFFSFWSILVLKRGLRSQRLALRI